MRIAKIKPNDVVNGKGVMVSVYVQGCPHHCKGCFNKDTWSFSGGEEFTPNHFDKILKMLDKDGVKRNLAILGGEPLAEENYIEVILLCNYIKRKRPETVIYLWTGYTLEEYVERHKIETLSSIDYLIDGRFIEEEKDITLELRGSKNQRVINLKKIL